MTEETKVPALPSLADIADPAARKFMAAAKEMLEVRDGRRGQKEDRFVTLRELASAGIAEIGSVGGDGKAELLPGAGGLDYATPPALANLKASGGYAQIFLEWDKPEYKSFSYVEVWRSKTDVIGSAIYIGESTAAVYSDPCGTQAKFYYWARAVSKAGIKGPFNAINGALAQTSDDIEYIMDQLTGDGAYQPFFAVPTRYLLADGSTWVEAGLYVRDMFVADGTITRTKIGFEAVDDSKIANLSAEKLKFGFAHGDRIELNTLKGNRFDVTTLAATFAVIEEEYVKNSNLYDATISYAKIANDIQSTNYSYGRAGWRIDKNGTMEMNNAVFRGTIDVKSAASGARTEITNRAIKVYNAAGTVVVQIGDLSA